MFSLPVYDWYLVAMGKVHSNSAFSVGVDPDAVHRSIGLSADRVGLDLDGPDPDVEQ